ncbi:MAG: ABC transporter ATP-binding protein [Cellulosilyticaceae bacterium]
MAKLEVKSLIKSFDNKQVLDGISFCVENGEMLGLVGASGCGKSTSLKVIAGLIAADEGSIWIDGQDVTQIPMEQRNTVIVFQDFLLFPHMNVEKNIAFGLTVQKTDKRTIQETTERLIQLVHLQGNEKKYPRDLSGGQKQRVAIARALAVEPKVLLLDEPFSSLDIRLRNEMREFIKEIHAQTDTTMILVTHDKEEAFDLCDKVGIMLDGKLMQIGEPKMIYREPKSKAVAEFFGPVNYVSGYVCSQEAHTVFGKVQSIGLEDGEYEWCVRPEMIYVDSEGVRAHIISSKFLGDRMLSEIQVANQRYLMQTDGRIDFKANQEVYVKCYLECMIKADH